MVSYRKLVSILAITVFFLSSPVTAGTAYFSGSPDLSVFISGSNEFSPGDDISIPVVVQNSGLPDFKLVQSTLVDRDDNPTTAKHLVITLTAGNAPLVIKSGPLMAGDLKSGTTITGVFTAKVDRNASSGNYQIPVLLNYTYLTDAEQYGWDSLRYHYTGINKSVILPVRIKPELFIKVISAEPEQVNIGTEGYLHLKILNSGTEIGNNAVVRISRNGDSPIQPVDSSVYIGTFLPGSVADCRYKISVSPQAERSVYPVDVAIVYENSNGDKETTRIETAGIPVGAKIDFSIVSPPAEIHPGQRKSISVEFKNTGSTKIFSAQARISAVDPFTSNDDIAYLGDIEPGQVVVSSFEVGLDRHATIKEYGLDSEIRYRDELDRTYISDPMKVRINVTKQEGFAAILSDPILLSVIVSGVIAILYGAYRFRKSGN